MFPKFFHARIFRISQLAIAVASMNLIIYRASLHHGQSPQEKSNRSSYLAMRCKFTSNAHLLFCRYDN